MSRLSTNKNSVCITLSYGIEPELDTSMGDLSCLEKLLTESKLITASDNFYQLFEYLTPSLMRESSYQSLVDYIADFSSSADGNFFKSVLISSIRDHYLGIVTEPVDFDLQSCRYRLSIVGVVDRKALKGFDVVINRNELKLESPVDVLQLSKEVLAQPSDQFFDVLVDTLAKVLAVDVVVAATVRDGEFSVIAGCFQGILQHGFRAPLSCSPFESLKQGFIVCPHNLSIDFPQCLWLAQQKVGSMLCASLQGADGSIVGFLAVMDSKPLTQEGFTKTLLSVFSSRASSEIEHRAMSVAVMQRHQRYQELIDKSQNGMFALDVIPAMPLSLPKSEHAQYLSKHARFSECNKAFLHLHGISGARSLLGLPLEEVLSEGEIGHLLHDFVAQDYSLVDRVNHNTSLKNRPWLSSSYSGQFQNDSLTHIYGECSDVSDKIEHTKQLAYQASHDELTQLPNRRFFREQFEQVISKAQGHEFLGLFILDLDGFKEINDTLGHVTGDELLTLVGSRLSTCIEGHEVLIARLGGDEFGLMIRDAKNESDLIDISISLVQAIKTPFHVKGLDLRIGGSVGVSCYPEHGKDFSSLMRCADVAMYQAKKLSKDVEVYQPQDDYYSVRRLSLMMEMRNAVDDGQLILYYQPITHLGDRTIKGFEALVRWNHPEHGLIPPGEFIPLIELTDVIEPLTWWVIETAVKQLQLWQQQGKKYTVSVNVSTRNISEDSFVYRLSRLLRQYRVDGRFLEIEITESTLMADPNKGRSVLKALSSMGIRFAVDDYGTGYSSLAYLKSLPIDSLKIDRAFIDQMLNDEQDQIIVRSTIQLAHNLGLKVTAEGIEDSRLIEELNSLGCDFGQGYFICCPVPHDKLEEWIALYDKGQHPISSVH